MSVPEDLRYTEEHEWVRPEDGGLRVGITHFAQDQLGDVVYVELPKVGATLRAGQPFGVVESVKAASDLYAPVAGTVVAVNEALADAPDLVNSDPFGEGWMLVLEAAPGAADGLLDADGYRRLIDEPA